MSTLNKKLYSYIFSIKLMLKPVELILKPVEIYAYFMHIECIFYKYIISILYIYTFLCQRLHKNCFFFYIKWVIMFFGPLHIELALGHL